MLFPFLYLAGSLSVGIFLASVLSTALLIPVVAFLTSLAAAWLAYFRKTNALALALALPAALFLGWSVYAQHDIDYEHNPVKRLVLEGYADFSGRLYRSPSYGVGRTQLYVHVEKFSVQGRDIKARGNLRVTVLHTSVYPSPLRLKAGDKITVSAQVLPGRDFHNFGESRLAGLRKNQMIHNHAVTKSVLLVELKQPAGPASLLRLISAFRQALQKRIEDHFSTADGTALSQQGAVLEAMLLGERGRMDEETTAGLQRSGLFHLIAISGAHIGIISVLFFFILRLFRVPKRVSFSILIILLLFYSLLVEGRASVFRATIMALTFLTSKLLWKQTTLLNTISFSAFVLLLSNPFYLFDMGFELTFAATLSIILFYPKLLSFLPRLPLKVSELFALSLTAQLGVLPLLAASFNRVTFAALLLNFPAIPLIGVVMGAGFVFLAVSPISPGLAALLAPGLRFLVDVFLRISHSLDAVPGFSYRLPTPPPAVVIGYFLFLSLLLLRARFKGQNVLTSFLFAVLLITLVTYPFPPRFSPALRLTFIDVGQGDSILVEFPGRKKMLVDGGGVPDSSFDTGEHVVSPFLWRRGIKKLDYVVLTHAHPDHLNGLLAVARNFRVGEFWEAYSPDKSPAYEEFKKTLSESALQRRVFRGSRLQEGPVAIEVLHPERSAPLEREVENDDSLVLRLVADDQSFLLASDIGMEAEKKILDARLEVRSRVLKSPHHGSRTSSSEAFLSAVGPEVVIISAGRGNIYGVPHPEILERYRAFGTRVLRTGRDGAIEISAAGRALVIRTAISPAPPD
ncbi:MAG: DNA internalization-related competence protein ComEC/Rec2 [Candidatus Aminicenantes bacterium RBG_19FT_COMBO_58_17]|nr:MAG: DNA internalization-related competence protein ComEC/Rec2 [Candidatus Aminicenantes bacterium RBG_19FT_COMBO_58_17]